MRFKFLALFTAFGLVMPVLAQDNFADIPENHWAFEAIENMKREGILVGYPDGTYKGARSTSRYELAVALNAAYQRLKNITDSLAEQVSEIRTQMQKSGGDSGLADRLGMVESQLRGMAGLRDDADNMMRMTKEFQRELAALGVDVEQMQKDIEAMKALMGEKPHVTISGDANIFMIAGAADASNKDLFDQSGHLLGQDDQGDTRGSILSDLNIYHEIAVNLRGGKSNQPKWDATIVHSSLLGNSDSAQGFGNQTGNFFGSEYVEGAGDTYIQRLAIDFSEVMPFNVNLGRIGLQTVNPYLLRRSDQTPYFSNARWDSGDWMMDGATSRIAVGTGEIRIFGGRNINRKSNSGVEIQPMEVTVPETISGGTGPNTKQFLRLSVQNTYGVDTVLPLGPKGNLNLAWLNHSIGASGSSNVINSLSTDRLEVIGGGLNYTLSDQFSLNTGFGISTPKSGSKDLLNSTERKRNKSYFADLTYKQSDWGASFGVRRIDQHFASAGDWGKNAFFYNERGIADAEINAWAKINSKWMIKGGFRSGTDLIGFGGENPKYSVLTGMAEYAVSKEWSSYIGYEGYQKDYKFEGADQEEYEWISFGVRSKLGESTLIQVVYQRMTGKSPESFKAQKSAGSLISGQISIRF